VRARGLCEGRSSTGEDGGWRIEDGGAGWGHPAYNHEVRVAQAD